MWIGGISEEDSSMENKLGNKCSSVILNLVLQMQ